MKYDVHFKGDRVPLIAEMTLHPQVIEKEGKKEFVVLPYDEFVRIQEALEDFEDLKELRQPKAQEGEAPTTTLTEVKEALDL